MAATTTTTPHPHWFETYRQHIIHLSVCIAILSYSMPQALLLLSKFDDSMIKNETKNTTTEETAQKSVTAASLPMIAVVLQTLCCLVCVLIIIDEVIYMTKRRTLPPGDSGYPILGHMPQVVSDPYLFFLHRKAKFGFPSTYKLFGTPCVKFYTDDDVNWLVAQERKGNVKAYVLEFLQDAIGKESIMFQSGEVHKRLRKLFEPAFAPQAIQHYATTMDDVTQTTLSRLASASSTNENEFCDGREWAVLAFRIFVTCAFGKTVVEDESKFIRMIQSFETWLRGLNSPIPFSLFPGSPLARALYHRDLLGKILGDMIDEFQQQHAHHPPKIETETDGNDDDGSTKNNLLGRLIYSVDGDGNPPTRKQLIDNLRFILVAGFDTTKSTFGALFIELSKHPTVYKALIEEVDGFASPLNVEELKSAPILNAVMAETWRLNSPLHGHIMQCRIDLEYKGYTIPKGTVVTTDAPTYHLTAEDRYPDATEFRIERWIPPGHPLYDPRYCVDWNYNVMSAKYRPFSVGTHSCLGAHFAKLEVRIVVTRLLQKYHIELRNEQIRRAPTYQRFSEFKLIERETENK